ncbi:MAG: phosphotransferase [Caldilineaceae bacterium]
MDKTLFAGVDELLAPETLQRLTGRRVTAVSTTPMAGGYSGSRLLQVTTDAEPPGKYVLKHMPGREDWLMLASADRHCRAVALWQHGLLDQLKPAIDHAILGCARDGDDWFILMRDVSTGLMPSDAWTAADVEVFLSALAELHAAFWNSPVLADPALGLCDAHGMVKTLTVDTARANPSATSPMPRMIVDGWELLQRRLEPDVAQLLAELHADPSPLSAVLSRYPKTLVHGDYRQANQAREAFANAPVVLLDWQLAGYAMPTIDLNWFLNKLEVAASPLAGDAAAAYYRRCLEARLGEGLSPTQWQAMLDLGDFVDVMRMGAFRAWFAANERAAEHRLLDEAYLGNVNQIVRRAMPWLLSCA